MGMVAIILFVIAGAVAIATALAVRAKRRQEKHYRLTYGRDPVSNIKPGEIQRRILNRRQKGIDERMMQHSFDDPEGKPVADTVAGQRFAQIAEGICPHCKKNRVRFLAGPVGGMSQNIECEACGWWFNVTAFPNGEGIAEDIGFKDRQVRDGNGSEPA